MKSIRASVKLWWKLDDTEKSLIQLDENETVMLKTRLRNGLISPEKGKLEFIYPGWTTPRYLIEDLMKKHHSCSDLELFVISNEKRQLHCQVLIEKSLSVGLKTLYFN